jgi:hypothetical protein
MQRVSTQRYLTLSFLPTVMASLIKSKRFGGRH